MSQSHAPHSHPTMKKTFFAVLTLLAFTTIARSDTTIPSKNKVVRAWYGQFRRIRTLRLQTTFTDNDIKDKTTNISSHKFVFSGGKYRGETDWPNTTATQSKKGYLRSAVGTFDGKVYSSLKISDQGAQLSFGKKSHVLNSMGFVPLNVEVLNFNEEKGDFNWILKMQRQEPWEQLVRRIKSITTGQRNGVNGYWVNLRFRGSDVSLFLNQELYPLHKKITRNKITSNIEIKSNRYVVDGYPIFIPARVDYVVSGATGAVTRKASAVLDKPAEINKPIRNAGSLFTIPKSQATLTYDTDEQP